MSREIFRFSYKRRNHLFSINLLDILLSSALASSLFSLPFAAMPKATPEIRQANSAARALATVVSMTPVADDKEAPSIEDPPKEQEDSTLVAPVVEKTNRWDSAGGQDFFDYLSSIGPEEQRTITLKIHSTNPDGSTGGLLKNFTGGWDKLDETWMREQFGVGKYKIEVKCPQRSPRRNDWTRVQIGTDDEIKTEARKKGGIKEGGTSEDADKAVDVVASAAEKGMGFLGKSYEKALEVRQNSSDPVALAKALTEMNGKQPDMAALMTGLGSLLTAVTPKKDDEGSKLLLTMLENQRKEAERRADEAEKRAIEDRRRDREEADRRERLAKEEADRRERDRKDEMERRDREYKDRQDRDNKFWELMLKEKEKKSDEFGLTDLLKGIVVPLVKERIEGGGSPEGWAGVAANLIDRAPDAVAAVSAMMAARNGATPAQVQQIAGAAQQPQQLQPPQATTPQTDFAELMKRIAKYLSRDDALWNTDDGKEYILGMIEEEYAGLRTDLFVNQPREVIYQAIQADQYGANILAHPVAKGFIESIVDSIKIEETGGEAEEPERVEVEQRKPNGRGKKTAVAS